MTDRLDFFTPVVGRFVSGSITDKRNRDHQNREIPEDKQQYQFGVAFEKAAIWPWMDEQLKPFLNGVYATNADALNRVANWSQTMNGFSMKITNGDAPNQKGAVNENTKGCYVFWFSSAFPIEAVETTMTTNIDASLVKRGYYVQVAGNLQPNGLQGDHTGIYMNATHVRLVAEGEEIRGGVDAMTAFGGSAVPALPAGAKPLGTATGMPGAGAPQTPQAGMPGATAPQTPQAGMPGVNPTTAGTTSPGNVPATTPHTGILSGPV